jgi:hypothetical protein
MDENGVDRRGALQCMLWAGTGTLQEAIGEVIAVPAKPAFMIHTRDISHLSKPQRFDADRVIGSSRQFSAGKSRTCGSSGSFGATLVAKIHRRMAFHDEA